MKIGQPMDSRAITWDKSFAGKYSERFDKAQKFIDAECIRHMVKYTPTLSTNLRKSATRGTKIGSGQDTVSCTLRTLSVLRQAYGILCYRLVLRPAWRKESVDGQRPCLQHF